MKKLIVSLILLGLGLSAQAADKKYVIGMSQCNLGEPWRVQMNADVKRAADKHPNIEVIYKDAQNDTLKQVSQIREFIAAKVDLLIVSPKEAVPLTPPVAEAYKAGIPVIVLDRRVTGGDYTEFLLDGQSIAGGTEMNPMVPAEVPSYWLAYFTVQDVDRAFAAATAAGGREMLSPQDFPGGRFAIVADPQGAAFGLLKMGPRS